MKKNFWLNKRVIITGHTGFVGAWLTNLLITEKCKIFGISLPIKKDENRLFLKSNIKTKIKNFFFDLRDERRLNKTINHIKPDIMIHLAAQSIVSLGYAIPNETFETNAQVTSSILNCLKENKKHINFYN
jgi:CDP-glucose 4,6-dehydratase